MGSIAIFSSIISMSIFGLILYLGVTLYNYFFSRKGKNINYRDFYECGFRAAYDTNQVIDIHFTIVGLIFLIYEMEILILVPLCLNLGGSDFCILLIFFLSLYILSLSYYYEWDRYALNWTF